MFLQNRSLSVKPGTAILKIGRLQGNGLNEVFAIAPRIINFGVACTKSTRSQVSADEVLIRMAYLIDAYERAILAAKASLLKQRPEGSGCFCGLLRWSISRHLGGTSGSQYSHPAHSRKTCQSVLIRIFTSTAKSQ